VVRVLIALLLWLGLTVAAAAAEVIEQFQSDVVVRADGVLDVTETIRVRAEGDAIKRGIYRDVPLTFVDDAGRSHRVSFTLTSVEKDGRPEPYHTNSNASGIRIYAGEEDVLLSPGTYTYRFRYETGRQLRFLPDHTELFWNVTGNEWAFPILSAQARIALPGGAAPVNWTAYTGAFGARGTDFTGRVRPDSALEVATTRRLGPGEGLSVVVELPDALVAPPSGMQGLYYDFLDYRSPILGGLGFAGVLAFYVIAWNAVGRDPPKGTIIPLFHPPKGISPALAGYIRDWGWAAGGWRAFTAAALSLAVKGALVFDEDGDTIVLKRTAAAVDRESLPAGERAILDWVAGKGEVRIERASGQSVAKAFHAFKTSIEGENRNRFFRRNLGWFALGVALTVGALILVLAFGDLTEGEIGLLIATAFVGVFAGAFVVPLIRTVFGLRRVRSVVGAAIGLVALVVVGLAFASLIGEAARALPDDFANTVLDTFLRNGFPFLLVGGFAALNGLFYYLLRAPTAAGRKVMDQVEGLELYIRTAETNRLNLAGAPDLTTTEFERLLPYAVAVDAEKPWSDAFAAAFARARPGEDLAVAYAPAWHGGHGWGGRGFGTSMASAVSSIQSSFQSAVPPPKSSSSGFSGGGGSGSGGGGGGGGGW
jgi:uncharacterized membrane protein YgcG